MNTATQAPWLRVTRNKRCPLCDAPDWCGISPDGAMCICMRVSDGSIRSTRNGGFLHKLSDDASSFSRRAVGRSPVTPRPVVDMEVHARRFHDAVDLDLQLETEAKWLGVSAWSLFLLWIGWSHNDNAWSFPMRDENKKIIGIRLRSPSGKKWCVKGSRTGLFIPLQFDNDGPLFICEGPTDLAALITVGFDAIGRPSNVGGVDLIVRFLKTLKPKRDVVIVRDRDEPESMAETNTRRGVDKLIEKMAGAVKTAKEIAPPRHKDIRKWVQEGATKKTINCVARSAKYRVTFRGLVDDQKKSPAEMPSRRAPCTTLAHAVRY